VLQSAAFSNRFLDRRVGFFRCDALCFHSGTAVPGDLDSAAQRSSTVCLFGLVLQLNHADDDPLVLLERVTEHRLVNSALVRLNGLHIANN